jgi:hypothetical protein
MNKPATFCLLAIVIAASPCCEQQTYEETKMFNQSSHPVSHGGSHDTGKSGAAGHAPEKH